MIIAQTATVYKTSHGRRFLTKRAAYLAEAINRLKRKDRHEPQGIHDELRGGEHHQEIYYSEQQWDHFKKVSSRYYRRFGRRRS